MSWTVEFTDKAKKELRKLDKPQRSIILRWIYKHLEGCENPRALGIAMAGNWSNYWRYRIGTYRIVCELQDSKLTVLVVKAGHRSSVYKAKRA